jgi:hypothetical protein
VQRTGETCVLQTLPVRQSSGTTHATVQRSVAEVVDSARHKPSSTPAAPQSFGTSHNVPSSSRAGQLAREERTQVAAAFPSMLGVVFTTRKSASAPAQTGACGVPVASGKQKNPRFVEPNVWAKQTCPATHCASETHAPQNPADAAGNCVQVRFRLSQTFAPPAHAVKISPVHCTHRFGLNDVSQTVPPG